MRNDALDELDDVPSLSTDAQDRDEFGHHPRRVASMPARGGRAGYEPEARGGASTGPLWALLGATVIAFCGLGWWSFQQISMMEQQLVATQESFARISEEAAGRIKDISGKVVATESNVTSGSESIKLDIRQLQSRLAEVAKQQQALSAQLGSQDKRVEQLSGDFKTQSGSAGQLDSRLQSLAEEQARLKAAQGDAAKLDERIKALAGEVEALKKQGNPSQAIKSLEQDLLVLRSQLDSRPAQAPAAAGGGANQAEFDAFRAQMTRNISTLQSQVQNLQQQINAR